ncbi:unnamed protein product [Calypogeia fissa]
MKFGSNTYGNTIKIADEQFQFSSGPEAREGCKIFEEQWKGEEQWKREDGNGLLVQVGELRGRLSMARTLNANEEAAMKTRMAEAKKRQRSCKEVVMNHTNSMILKAVPKQDSSQKKLKMAPVVKTEISTKELQRFLITLLVDKPTGLSMKAVQKALEEAMPDTMPDHKRIRRMAEAVASYQAPGKYVLKDGVQKEFYAKPSSDSGSSQVVPAPKQNSPEIADAHYIRIGRYESLMEGSPADDARGNSPGKEDSIVEDGEIVMVHKNVSICSATEDNNVEDGEIVMGDNNISISSSTEAENDVEDGEIVNGDNNVSISSATQEENHVEDGEIATGYNNVSISNATEHNNVEDGEIFIGDNVSISRATEEDSNVEDGEIVMGDNNVSTSRATEDSNVEDGEIVMGDTTDSISSVTEVDNNVEDTEIVDIGDSDCGGKKRSWTRQSGDIEGPEFFAPYEKRAAELKSSILQYEQYLGYFKEYSEKYQVYVRLSNILNGTKAHFESLSREITLARATKSKLEQVYGKVWRDYVHGSKRLKRMKRTFFVLHDELEVIKQHCKEYAEKVNKGDGFGI